MSELQRELGEQSAAYAEAGAAREAAEGSLAILHSELAAKEAKLQRLQVHLLERQLAVLSKGCMHV